MTTNKFYVILPKISICISEQRSKIEEISQKNEQLQRQVSTIKATNVILEHRNKELEEKVKLHQSDQSKLLFSKNKLLQIEKAKYKQLQTQFSKQAKEKAELIIRIEQFQKENSELKTDEDQLKKKIEQFQHEILKLKTDEDQLKKKISNLNDQLVEKNKGWQYEHARIKAENEQLQIQFKEQTKVKSELGNQYSELKKENDTLQNKILEISQNCVKYQKQLAESEEKLDISNRVKSQVKNLQKKLSRQITKEKSLQVIIYRMQ